MLFFGYGLLSDVDALTIVLAALGAICVASAVLLILERATPTPACSGCRTKASTESSGS